MAQSNGDGRGAIGSIVKWLEEYHELSMKLLEFEHPADREQFYQFATKQLSLDRKQHELEAVKERLSIDIPFLEEMKHRLDNSQDNLVDYEGVMGMIDDWLAELKAERERLSL